MLRNPGLRKSVEQPVLDLNFAASQIGSNAAPDSRIDFSRGSNAWFVDTDGLVKKSPHNLHTYSEQFDNAYWQKNNASVTANQIAAPDGTLTADLVTENTVNNTHFLFVNLAFNYISGNRYNQSVYLKANGRTNVRLEWRSNWFPADRNVVFDLAAGTATPGADATGSIEDVGNGWFRCEASSTANATGSSGGDLYIILLDDSGNASYTGDGTSGVYVWGAQLSQHYVLPVGNPYVKTEGSAVYAARLDHDPTWFMSAAQEQNLEANSEDLDAARDFKVRVTVTDNDTTAPDGTTTADKMVVDGTANSTHYLRFVYETQPDIATTFSLHAKADELSQFRIRTYGSLGFENSAASTFDLSAGTASKAANHTTATIEALDDGWFRVSVTENTNSDDETRLIQVELMSGGSDIFDGDSTSGMHFWGIQFEVGSTASTYHRTEGAPYYGEGATPKGLLIEEARTNLITDSESHTYLNGDILVAQTANSGLAPDGTNTAIAFMETAGTGNHVSRRTGITIADNGNIIFSFFVKANGRIRGAIELFGNGTGGAFAVFRLDTVSFESSNAYSGATNLSKSIEDYGNGWFRVTLGITTVSGGTAGTVQIRLYDPAGTNEYAGDATKGFLIWGMQLEQGNFPTSYIKTTGSSATRNADVATMGPTVAPDKLGPELVTNGTYPVDTNGWAAEFGCTISQNSGSLRVAATTSGVGAKTAIQTISNFVVGRRYRVSYLMVGNSVSGSLQSRLRIRDGFTNVAEVYPVTNGQTRSVDFTATNTTLNVQLRWDGLSGTGIGDYVDFDNVSVKEILPGQELVTNGTFDTDSDWTDNGSGTIAISSGKLTFASTAQFKNANQSLVPKLVAGRRYRASFDVTSYTSGTLKLQYREGSSNTLIAETTGTSAVVSGKSFDFTCSDAAVNKVQILTTGSGTTNTYEVDNVSVRELYPFERFNNTDGTFVLDAAGFDVPNQTVMQVDQGAINTPPYLRFSILDTVSARIFATISSSAANSFDGSVAVNTASENRVAFAYGTDPSDGVADKVQAATNGTVHAEGTTDASIGGFERVLLGNGAFFTDPAALIKRIRYFNRRLLTQELKAITDD